MPKGVHDGHRPPIRVGDACIRCGLADPAKLYACSLVRYWNRDGRHSGRSIGPVKVCRTCAAEILRTPRRRGPLARSVA